MANVYTQLAADTFTRANSGTLGSNWVNNVANNQGLQIVSNAAQALVASLPNAATFNALNGQGSDFSYDHYAQVTISTFSNTNCQVGPLARQNQISGLSPVSGTVNGYFGGNIVGSAVYGIYRVVANVFTQLAITAVNVTVNDVVRLAVQGGTLPGSSATLTLFQNASQISTVVDATPIQAGWPGLLVTPDATISHAAATTWSAGNVTVAPSNTNFGPLLLGQSAQIGTITAAGQTLQFSVAPISEKFLGKLQMVVAGGSVLNPVWSLEGGQDSFATHAFMMPAFTVPGLSNLGDLACIYAQVYDISGLGGVSFKFGLVSGTVQSAVTVFALVG